MKKIISFTTIPSRINKTQEMINSLLNQTMKPDEIVLWIGKEYKRVNGKIEIPKFIADTDIKVKYCDDIGPFTKLFYSLKENWEDKECLIITADDDVFYPPTWFENLIKTSELYPNSAIGYRGRVLNPNNRLDYIRSRIFEGSPTEKPLNVDIITGTWGALYKPRFFTDFIFNHKVINDNFFVDDIWITGNLVKNNTQRLIINNVGVKPILKLADIEPLSSINHRLRNESKTLKYFNDEKIKI